MGTFTDTRETRYDGGPSSPSPATSSSSSHTTPADWDRLDKPKFFLLGSALFSSVTLTLYPLTVVKTRQMASDVRHTAGGLSGAVSIVRHVLASDGPRGLYKGLGTVVFGTIPARMVYLTTFESVRAQLGHHLDGEDGHGRYEGLSGAARVGLTSFVGGFTASLFTQSISVPVDVISQRLMVTDRGARGAVVGAVSAASVSSSSSSSAAVAAAKPLVGSKTTPPGPGTYAPKPKYTGMIQTGRLILAEEGIRGLYRGLPVSLLTYAPSSAIWWSAYSVYQSTLRSWLYPNGGGDGSTTRTGPAISTRTTSTSASPTLTPTEPRAIATIVSSDESGDGTTGTMMYDVAIQVMSGVGAGCTNAMLTNPLDVVKTRLQVRAVAVGMAPPTVGVVVRDLYQAAGVKGFFRGVVPRMASAALWGTSMVSVYEFLKRVCVKE